MRSLCFGALRFGVCAVSLCAVGSEAGEDAEAPRGLTAVEGLSVGHHTLAEKPTGCTVILTGKGAVAGVDVRGGAPGTRETDLLDPSTLVQSVHAIVLSGGSAYGLDAAGGVMRFLEEAGIGYPVSGGVVPIVPAAIIFDLPLNDMFGVRPTADCGYRAARDATTGLIAEGNVGAGAGATLGKMAGTARAMKGGLGTASLTLPGGLTIAALVVVNAWGDVIDPATGKVIAGVRTLDGKGLADARRLLRSGTPRTASRPDGNSVVGVVATNAQLTQAEARKVAQMAHDGYARAIAPVHTPFDGDTIFALATGRHSGSQPLGVIGALAADVMAEAILRAVRQAESIPGYPAAKDLESNHTESP